MSLKARYGSMTKSEKLKRRRQDHFNKGIKKRSASIIRGSKQITRIDTDETMPVATGNVGVVFKGEDFEVYTELMAPGVNTGIKVAAGDLVLIVQDGRIAVRIDGKSTLTVTSGGVVSIKKDSQYEFSTFEDDWVNLLRVQSVGFSDGIQLTEGRMPNQEVLDTQKAISGKSRYRIQQRDRRSRQEYSRYIAGQAHGHKVQTLKRKGVHIDTKRVSIAGTPVK